VRAKEADLGQFVNPGTRLGVMFATDFAEVPLPLTDSDLAFVDLPGATELASSDGPMVHLVATQKGRQAQWKAQIVRTEGVVDEKSRVTYAVARIVDPYQRHGDGNALPIGTFVKAAIEGSAASNVIQVPRRVVRGSNELLFLDADNKIEIRQVDIIRSDAEFSYVGGGAGVGERIVVSAVEAPISGMSVRTEDSLDEESGPAAGENGSEL
jgi:hypothetical protein